MLTYLNAMNQEQIRKKFKEKLPDVEPTDRDLSVFALGMEAGVTLWMNGPVHMQIGEVEDTIWFKEAVPDPSLKELSGTMDNLWNQITGGRSD